MLYRAFGKTGWQVSAIPGAKSAAQAAANAAAGGRTLSEDELQRLRGALD